MAQKIVTLCDPHLSEHDQEVPGEPYRIGIQAPGGRWQWLEIDLCAADAAEVGLLATWLERFGREFQGADPQPGPGRRKRRSPKTATGGGESDPMLPVGEDEQSLACPVCDYVGRTKTSLMSHTVRVHGKRLTELHGAPLPYVCNECGAAFTRTQGLGVHIKTQHPDA